MKNINPKMDQKNLQHAQIKGESRLHFYLVSNIKTFHAKVSCENILQDDPQ